MQSHLLSEINELKNQVKQLVAWKQQVHRLSSANRKRIKLNLQNPHIENFEIHQKLTTLIKSNMPYQWATLTSTQQLERSGSYIIELKIQSFGERVQDKGYFLFGIIHESLINNHDCTYNQKGSIHWGVGGQHFDNQYSQVIVDGTPGSFGKMTTPGSIITMLLDWGNNKVSWYLDRIVKLAERPIPQGKFYASLGFSIKSVVILL